MTDRQWSLLEGLVADARNAEFARAKRMKARPPGAHTPESIALAEASALELTVLRQAVADARLAG